MFSWFGEYFVIYFVPGAMYIYDHVHIHKCTQFECPRSSWQQICPEMLANSLNIFLAFLCMSLWEIKLIWAASWQNLFMPYANKGTDQPAHPRRLISAFVVRCLDSIMPILAISKVSRHLASVAEQTGLSLAWSQTLKTGFLVTRRIWSQLLL